MLKALQDLRIGFRIIIGNILLLVMMAGIAYSGYAGLQNVSQSYDIVLKRQEEVSNLRLMQLYLIEMANFQSNYIYLGDPVDAQAFQSFIPLLQEHRNKIRASIETEEERLNFNIINRQADEFINLFTKKILPAKKQGNSEDLLNLKNQSDELVSQMDPFIQNMIADYEMKASIASQNALDTRRQTIFMMFGLTTAAVSIGLISGIFLSRSISSGTRQIVQDSEQMRKTEEALRESESIFKQVVRAAPWGMHFYQIYPDGKFVLVNANPSAEKILKIENEKLIGKPINETLPQIGLSNIPVHIAESIKFNQPWDVDNSYYHYEKNKSNLEIHFFQISNNQIVIAFLDIAEKQRIEEERERFMHELSQINKELESIVYVASHDLRSPLLNIMGFGKLLQSAAEDLEKELIKLGLDEQQTESIRPILQDRIPQALHFITSSANKMDVLINGLLRLSRTGKSALFFEKLDMNPLIQSVLDAMHFQLQKAQVKIQVDSLPACIADGNQIGQVFTNLLDNAIKYQDPQRSLEIKISGKIKDQHAVYCIEDNGLGIAPEHQEKIWELFHRLNPTGPVTGEGLGLTLVLRILDRNQGQARVESEPGVGSKFFIQLPLAQNETSMTEEQG